MRQRDAAGEEMQPALHAARRLPALLGKVFCNLTEMPAVAAV
jgi:hypothetical protein